MHPIERLRYVARVDGAGAVRLTLAAAHALAGLGRDHAALVTGCRQMVDRHPAFGTMWWLTARVLAGEDPDGEAWSVSETLENDETPKIVADQLPDEVTVLVLGWPELIAPALHRRADLHVLVVDSLGEGRSLVDSLDRVDVDAAEVPESGIGAAAAETDLVLLEALSVGPDGAITAPGSRAAAAVARQAGAEVWLVVGEGRVLPAPMWKALVRRLDDLGDPWDREDEFVPIDMIDVAIGPWGRLGPAEAVMRSDCPVTPELFKGVFAPGTQR